MLFVHSPEEAQRAKRRDFLIHFILFHFYSHSSYYGPRLGLGPTSRMPYGTGSPKPVSSPNPTSQNVSAYRAGGESKGTETT